MQITLSSHVLDLDAGRPAAGMGLTLRRGDNEVVFAAATNEDGRVSAQPLTLADGESLSLVFATADWFEREGKSSFYPRVVIDFAPQEAGHYHIPLLINRHGYSTYRGS